MNAERGMRNAERKSIPGTKGAKDAKEASKISLCFAILTCFGKRQRANEKDVTRHANVADKPYMASRTRYKKVKYGGCLAFHLVTTSLFLRGEHIWKRGA